MLPMPRGLLNTHPHLLPTCFGQSMISTATKPSTMASVTMPEQINKRHRSHAIALLLCFG